MNFFIRSGRVNKIISDSMDILTEVIGLPVLVVRENKDSKSEAIFITVEVSMNVIEEHSYELGTINSMIRDHILEFGADSITVGRKKINLDVAPEDYTGEYFCKAKIESSGISFIHSGGSEEEVLTNIFRKVFKMKIDVKPPRDDLNG